VAGSGGDYWCLAISADDRRSWFSIDLPSGNKPGWGRFIHGPAEWQAGRSSLQGLREFWLRIDMVSHDADPRLAVQGFDLTIGFQHNMYVQPRLLPGENPLWVEAAEVDDGCRVEAEWVYQIDRRERREVLGLDQASRAARTVELGEVASPEEVLMTGVKLRCV
jgi:hypothetical protein